MPTPDSILNKNFHPDFNASGLPSGTFVPPTSLNFSYGAYNNSIYTGAEHIQFKRNLKSSLFSFDDSNNTNGIPETQTTINNQVIEHYLAELKKIEKETTRLAKKAGKAFNRAIEDFSALLKFEQEHPGIGRFGVKDKKEIPEGCEEFDFSMFGMGIGDDENKTYTGQCYSIGYIKGLENLSEEEQKEYLKLLKNTQKSLKKSREYEEQFRELDQRNEKNYALMDAAQSGMLNRVGSSEYENQVYNQWINIRNECNPYYREIKELEQKRNALWLKYNRTEEDDRLIEQYDIRIRQLENLSREWSISDSHKTIQPQDQGKLSSTVVTTSSDMYSSDYMSGSGVEDAEQAGFVFSDPNFNVSLDVRTSQRNISQSILNFSNLNMQPTLMHTATSNRQMSLNTRYSAGERFSITSTTSMDITNERQNTTSQTPIQTTESRTESLSQMLNITADNFNGSYMASLTNTQYGNSMYISGQSSYRFGPCNFEIDNTYNANRTNLLAAVTEGESVERPHFQPQVVVPEGTPDDTMNDAQESPYSSFGFKFTTDLGNHVTATASYTNSGIEYNDKNKFGQESLDGVSRKHVYEFGINGNFRNNSSSGTMIYAKPKLDFRYTDIGCLPTIMPGISAGVTRNIKGTTLGVNLSGNYAITINKNDLAPDYNNSTTLSVSVSGDPISFNGHVTLMNTSTVGIGQAGVTTDNRIRYGGTLNYTHNNYSTYLKFTYGEHTNLCSNEPQSNRVEKDIMAIAGIQFNVSSNQSRSNQRLQQIRAAETPELLEMARQQHILRFMLEHGLMPMQIQPQDK